MQRQGDLQQRSHGCVTPANTAGRLSTLFVDALMLDAPSNRTNGLSPSQPQFRRLSVLSCQTTCRPHRNPTTTDPRGSCVSYLLLLRVVANPRLPLVQIRSGRAGVTRVVAAFAYRLKYQENFVTCFDRE